jgi:hypothetical protein
MPAPSPNDQSIEALLSLRSLTLHVVHEADGIVAAVTRSLGSAEEQPALGDRVRTLNGVVAGMHHHASTLLQRLGSAVGEAGDRADHPPRRKTLRFSSSPQSGGAGMGEKLAADLHALSRLIDLLDEHRDAVAHRVSLTEAQSEDAVRSVAAMRAAADAGSSPDARVDAVSDAISNAEAAIAVLLHDLRIVDAMAALARLELERGVLIHAASGCAAIKEPSGYLGEVLELHQQQLLAASDIETRRQKAGDLLSALKAPPATEPRREDARSS